MTQPFEHESTVLPPENALAFAPIHKRHFGTAIGLAVGVVIAMLTLIDATFHPEGDQPLRLLGEYFYGYRVSIAGVFIGGAWGFFVGWVGGWFVAFWRNFILAAMVFWVRAKVNLRASREFLDHI